MKTFDLVTLNDPRLWFRSRALKHAIISRSADFPELTEEVNNHVHTKYSYSPYSPIYAAYSARAAGLRAVGSVDHDSIGAAFEMAEACRVLGIASTTGCELRVSFAGTRLEGRKINNPDTDTIAYIVFHGVPRTRIGEVSRFLEPIRAARFDRNRHQVDKLNSEFTRVGLPPVSFESDVYPSSWARAGGSITERHILEAATRAVMKAFPRPEAVMAFLTESLGVELNDTIRGYLAAENNPHRVYDLLGVLKSSFLPRFYVEPDDAECISVRRAVEFANSVGAIPAYAYLGDVAESPTGDKKAESFEDEYLELLFDEITSLGFKAVTYMPPRNTPAQLERVMRLCASHKLLEISGVDINSSRQSFTCSEVMLPEYRHLIDATWALIAHEKLSASDPRQGLFSKKTTQSIPDLVERVAEYAAIGRSIDPRDPEASVKKTELSRST